MEVTWRRGRRRKKLLDELKDRRGCSHLKEEALDRTMWRAGFGRGFGPVVRQTTEWMNDSVNKSFCRLCSLNRPLGNNSVNEVIVSNEESRTVRYGLCDRSCKSNSILKFNELFIWSSTWEPLQKAHDALKTAPCTLTLATRFRRVASLSFRPLHLRGRILVSHCSAGWMVPNVSLDVLEKKRNLYPAGSRKITRVTARSLVTIPTQTSEPATMLSVSQYNNEAPAHK